jgi:hypothetical protein
MAEIGQSKVAFSESEDVGASLSVDTFTLDEKATDAQQQVIQDFLRAMQRTKGYVLRAGPVGSRIARRNGKRVEYTYTGHDGQALHGIAVAVGNAQTGITYLVTAEVPEQRWASLRATFETMLKSFSIG